MPGDSKTTTLHPGCPPYSNGTNEYRSMPFKDNYKVRPSVHFPGLIYETCPTSGYSYKPLVVLQESLEEYIFPSEKPDLSRVSFGPTFHYHVYKEKYEVIRRESRGYLRLLV